jgi:hypothetical protein
VHLHAAAVRDLLAGEERAHDGDALGEASPSLVARRPGVAGDVLVERLARAQRRPQPGGEHDPERRDRLGEGEDRRVIALPRRAYGAKRHVGRLQSCAEPRPRETAFSLVFAPRRERHIPEVKPAASGATTSARRRSGGRCS